MREDCLLVGTLWGGQAVGVSPSLHLRGPLMTCLDEITELLAFRKGEARPRGKGSVEGGFQTRICNFFHKPSDLGGHPSPDFHHACMSVSPDTFSSHYQRINVQVFFLGSGRGTGLTNHSWRECMWF